MPEWMCRPEASRVNLRELPRLPLQALSELHGFLETFLLEPTSQATGEHDETSSADLAQGSVRTADARGAPDTDATRAGDCASRCTDHRSGPSGKYSDTGRR